MTRLSALVSCVMLALAAAGATVAYLNPVSPSDVRTLYGLSGATVFGWLISCCIPSSLLRPHMLLRRAGVLGDAPPDVRCCGVTAALFACCSAFCSMPYRPMLLVTTVQVP